MILKLTEELFYLLFGLAVENNTIHDPGLGSYWTTDLKTPARALWKHFLMSMQLF